MENTILKLSKNKDYIFLLPSSISTIYFTQILKSCQAKLPHIEAINVAGLDTMKIIEVDKEIPYSPIPYDKPIFPGYESLDIVPS